jgi:hypothetical protein
VGDPLREQLGDGPGRVLQQVRVGEEAELVEVHVRPASGGEHEIAVELRGRDESFREIAGHGA